MHQAFSGAFTYSEALLTSISVSLEAFKKEIAISGITDNDVLATSVAVVYLEDKMADEQDSWELVVDKARQWLEEQCQGIEGGVEKVLAIAKKLVA